MRLFFKLHYLAAGAIALCVSMPVGAVETYGTPQVEDALLLSARPGEYYYTLGAEAVRHNDYAHAIEMYLVAASWAEKKSEYNLGVMYVRGEGVAVDLPRAMAWMALAAERGDKRYVHAREVVASTLDKDGLTRAEAILRELVPVYGDAVALNRAKERWHEVRNEATGSHVGFVGNLVVGAPGQNDGSGQHMHVESQHVLGKLMMEGNTKVSPPPSGMANAGAHNAFEAMGTSGIDGAKAYGDLHLTDNPYDPRFGHGVATVGPLISVGEKKADPHPDSTETVQPQTDARQQQ